MALDAPPLLSLRDVRLTFGGTPLLEGIDLSVGQGERLCLVGRNGSGKSTLLKIAAGLVEPDGGDRVVRQGTTIRYLPQEPDFSGHATVLDYVEAGLGPGDEPYRAAYLIAEVGLTGAEDLRHLSGGESRRAALARALAPEPDILLLDEPTNHLDLPAIEWLEAEISRMRSAVVLISHDRRFLQNLSRATVWLDRGRTRRHDRGFADFEGWRDTVLEEEERDAHKLERRIVAEEHWVRYGVTARRKRNQGRMRALADMRREARERRRAAGTVRFTVSEGGTSGKLVIEAKEIRKAFDERVLVDDFSTRVARGDRVGLVGPNGVGKSTLLAMLIGELPPDSGTVKLGANLQVVAVDQRRDSLDPATVLSAALTRGSGDTVLVGGQSRHIVSYMRDFLFSPEQAGTPLGKLSGGERGRVMLARALATPSNVLVLDEPTNDLDLETLDLLQEMIADYPGTVLLVSHDRDFLDRTVTSTVAAEGAGRWTEYAGGYSDMLAQRRTDSPAPAARSSSARPAGLAPVSSPRGRAKLSFKDKHALETLPARIDALQDELAALTRRMADPGFFTRDPGGFGAASQRMTAIQSELDAAEERWLELEMLREDTGG